MSLIADTARLEELTRSTPLVCQMEMPLVMSDVFQMLIGPINKREFRAGIPVAIPDESLPLWQEIVSLATCAAWENYRTESTSPPQRHYPFDLEIRLVPAFGRASSFKTLCHFGRGFSFPARAVLTLGDRLVALQFVNWLPTFYGDDLLPEPIHAA